jgi:hypothetical protein
MASLTQSGAWLGGVVIGWRCYRLAIRWPAFERKKVTRPSSSRLDQGTVEVHAKEVGWRFRDANWSTGSAS